MGDTQTAIVVNEDGSYTFIGEDGKSTKLVKASDLMAVKDGAEKKEGELLAQVAEANRTKEESHQQLLQAQTANQQFEEQVKESATYKDKVAELEPKLTAANEAVSKLETDLLGMTRTHLVTVYGASEDSVKDKDVGQLKSLEEALKSVGGGGKKPANYDGGPPPGAAPALIAGREKEKQELTFAKELQKKSPSDTDYIQ